LSDEVDAVDWVADVDVDCDELADVAAELTDVTVETEETVELAVVLELDEPLEELPLVLALDDVLEDACKVLLGVASKIYPNRPWLRFPHLSGGYPGHGSSQSDKDTVSPGCVLEHQHSLSCKMANANPWHVCEQSPLDWLILTDTLPSAPVFWLEQNWSWASAGWNTVIAKMAIQTRIRSMLSTLFYRRKEEIAKKKYKKFQKAFSSLPLPKLWTSRVSPGMFRDSAVTGPLKDILIQVTWRMRVKVNWCCLNV
jgi:hypothetical protein